MRNLLAILLLTGLAQAQTTVPLNQGWNGVAFQNAQVTDLGTNPAIAGQATFDGTAYQTGQLTPAAVNAGDGTRRGFWVFATGATNLTYTGQGQSNSLTLRSGYNLVSFASSSPITALTAQVNGQTVPLGSVVLTTFTQIDANGQYTPVNVGSGGTLQPGRPYWVFANGPVTLGWGNGPAPSPSPAGSPPGGFSLVTPANRTTGAAAAPQLTWSAASGAATYTVEVATTPSFGASKILTHSGIVGTTDTLSAAELNAGMVAYFWRVTATSASGGTTVAGPFWFSQPVKVDSSPAGIAASATRAVVAGDIVRVLNLATGTFVSQLAVPGIPRGVAVSPNGSLALVTTSTNNVSAIGLSNGQLIGNISNPTANASLGDLTFSPDGSRVLLAETRAATSGAGVSFFNPTNLNFGLFFGLNTTTATTQGVAFTPDGATSVAGLGPLELARSLSNAGLLTNLQGLSGTFSLRALAAPEILAATSAGVLRYSLATNTTTATFQFPTAPFTHTLEVTPDRSLAVAIGDSSVAVLNLQSNSISHTIPLAGCNSVTLYTSPAGEVTALVTVTSASEVRVLSLR